MKPAGSSTGSVMLHLALTRLPGGRANVPEMVKYLTEHQGEIKWPNPNRRELEKALRNAIGQALKGPAPKIIAHAAQLPKSKVEYTLA